MAGDMLSRLLSCGTAQLLVCGHDPLVAALTAACTPWVRAEPVPPAIPAGIWTVGTDHTANLGAGPTWWTAPATLGTPHPLRVQTGRRLLLLDQ
ncbi:hypothetical protein AB0M44_49555 [Streptosporangium subroseum]|uniref:hypothetical protein n=1 Tax=Streptosporangium subroseum TaxID=106412 RepID=UPI0034267F37